MTASPRERVTQVLQGSGSDSGPATLDRLVPLVYDELRALARHSLRSGGDDLTLSPTELVHEAYVRLTDASQVTAHGRAYFFAAAARSMRRIIVEHARRRGRFKRGGGVRPLTLNEAVALTSGGRVPILELELGLERLATVAERAARVVECRFYGGLSVSDTALTLGVTSRTVNRDWEFARAWLYDFLTGAASGAEA